MTIREIAETLDATWLCCEEEGDRRFARPSHPT